MQQQRNWARQGGDIASPRKMCTTSESLQATEPTMVANKKHHTQKRINSVTGFKQVADVPNGMPYLAVTGKLSASQPQ
jgi:hypothetical protein